MTHAGQAKSAQAITPLLWFAAEATPAGAKTAAEG